MSDPSADAPHPGIQDLDTAPTDLRDVMDEAPGPFDDEADGVLDSTNDDDLARAEALALEEAEDDVEPVATLRIERGGIGEATAGQVDVRLGGIGALSAEDVFVEWGGIGAARTDRLGVEFGSVGAVLAGEARVTQGVVGSIAAREATLEQGIVRTMFAQRVVINRPSAVLVMIAQHVSGDVRPLLDWRGALAAGAAFGLVSAVFRIVRGRD